jgi:CHAT domain-containing protein
MSLWKVPDRETYEIMGNFYSLWLDGYTKQEALRLASLKVLEEQRNSHNSGHPYFWGGFILSGNPY